MDWGPLATTALGALIGVSSTLASEQLRWVRRRRDADQAAKRALYADYLAALSRTRNELRLAGRLVDASAAERARRAADSFKEGGAYEMRYHVALVAPRPVVAASTTAFRALRDIRDAIEDGADRSDEYYRSGRDRWNEAFAALRQEMRRDLGIADTLVD